MRTREKHTHIESFRKWETLLKKLKTDFQKTPHRKTTLQPIEGHHSTPEFIQYGGRQKFVLWNTNSIRQVCQKGHFRDFVKKCNADHIGITESRGTAEDILLHDEATRVLQEEGYAYKYFNHNEKNKGMYGTTFFTKIGPIKIIKDIKSTEKEGRVITAIFEHFIVVTTYTPTLGLDKEGKVSKQERRHEFDRALQEHLTNIKREYNKPIIFSGDLNCCHKEEDIWDKQLINTEFPSCTLAERERLQNIIDDIGVTDSYEQGIIHKKYWEENKD
jgi:exodeoxyribonuclease III